MANIIDTDLVVNGSLTILGAYPAIARTQLTQETNSEFDIPLTGLRVWNAFDTLIATAGTDDLGLTAGAFGTGTPYVTAGSLGSVGATTRYARGMLQIPANYVDGQAARFVFLAGITGGTPVAASVSCSVDVEAYKVGTNTLISGVDVVATAATSNNMNSTTFASVAFDLTATTLTAGDWLDFRITIACNDGTASAANVVPAIQQAQFQCATKG